MAMRTTQDGAFIWVAGDPDHEQETMRSLMEHGYSLPDAQVINHRRGSRGYQLVRSIYGWTVRSDSGIDGWAIRYQPNRQKQAPDAGFKECVAWVRGVCAGTNDTAFVRGHEAQRYGDEMVMTDMKEVNMTSDYTSWSFTDEDIVVLKELGEEIGRSLECNANGTTADVRRWQKAKKEKLGTACKVHRYHAMEHMIKYLQMHHFRVEAGIDLESVKEVN